MSIVFKCVNITLGEIMRQKKLLLILLIIFLIAMLILVINSRSAETGDVSIDGGERPKDKTDIVLTEEKPTDKSSDKEELKDLPDIDITSWQYVLANRVNEYTSTPQVSQIGNTGFYFDSRALEELTAMISDCRNAGNSITINLAYVPYASQEIYFDNKVEALAGDDEDLESYENIAVKTVPKAGCSDHQTALAVDFADDYYGPYSEDMTLSYDTLQWLVKHCAEYGFIQRYPDGKAGVTGYTVDGHFRYVGTDAAKYITDNNITLEEFIALYN